MLIDGMDCAHCARKLEESILAIDGVDDAVVSFATGRLYLRHSGVLPEVEKVVRMKGYNIRKAEESRLPASAPGTAPVVLSAASLVLAVVFSVYLPGLTKIPLLAAVLCGGMTTFRRGLSALRLGQFDMNVLMTVAVAGALLIGEWWEAATVAFLFAAGNTLEAYTAEKNRRSIRALMEDVPDKAHRLAGGNLQTVNIGEIAVSEVILVRPGEKIPLDGVVVEGESPVSESAVTGEPLPVNKKAGDAVFAGSLNGNGSLQVRVTRTAADSTLARIVRLVEKAQLERSPAERFVDRFARYYTPAVLALAVVVTAAGVLYAPAMWRESLYRGLALLLVACPCALVVSTPVSVVAALSNAARNGVLIKGGAYLEAAGGIKAMVFDKTGTLTEGRPRVTKVLAAGGPAEEDVLQIAASLEAFSEHVLAKAICEASAQKMHARLPVENFAAEPGKGVRGTIDGREYFLGTAMFLQEKGIRAAGLPEAEPGETAVYLAGKEGLLGTIFLSDTLRPESAGVLNRLRSLGVGYLAMLSGDRDPVARAVSEKLGLDSVFGDLLPEQKEEKVRLIKEKYGVTAMVGDGINDAPALALADIGIAMGAAASATALETADVALLGDDLSRLPFLVELSRRTVSVIRQNIALALFIKAAALVMILSGHLTLWLAILADTGASLSVTANGMRLLYSNTGRK